MRLHFLAFIYILCTPLLHAQEFSSISKEKEIESVIQNYIYGTSYSDADRLKMAFLPGAQMFLDKEGSPLFVLSIEEYAAGVARGTKGKFNGRVTNVLSIDHFEGIATAKLEVLIPRLQKRFVDYLLLKELDDGWKIISKTAGSEPSSRLTNKVLIVTSSHSIEEKSQTPTGNSFSEIAIAYNTYQSSGYHIDFVSPEGGQIPLSYINPAEPLNLNSLYNPELMYAISHTMTPAEADPSQYDIIMYTGGSSPMFDIPQNAEIQELGRRIYEEQEGVIAAVCHGSAGILNIKTSSGEHLISGKKLNGYPSTHERKDSKIWQNSPLIIEEEIEKRGGQFSHGPRGESYYIVDDRLVTGQNYQSTKDVALRSIELSQASQRH